jgi:hypothetical protein
MSAGDRDGALQYIRSVLSREDDSDSESDSDDEDVATEVKKIFEVEFDGIS